MSALRILVTAIGGDVGQAVVKALRVSSLNAWIVGADAQISCIGAAFADAFHVLPFARDSAAYMHALNAICAREQIDVLIPVSEAEISLVAGCLDRIGCAKHVLVHSGAWLSGYGDKLNCMWNLDEKVPLAAFADADQPHAVKLLIEKCGFPLVVKSRRGFGSKSLGVAKKLDELQMLIHRTSPAIVMEYIPDTLGEFSIGVYRDKSGCHVLPIRRTLLGGGCSWYGEVTNEPEVVAYAEAIAKWSGLYGAANVQVRRNENGVFLLEMNARLSSLAAARAAAGFHDVEWWVRSALGLPISFPASYSPIRFQRYYAEMIDEGAGWVTKSNWLPQNIE